MCVKLSINYDRISFNKDKVIFALFIFVKLNFENMNMQN